MFFTSLLFAVTPLTHLQFENPDQIAKQVICKNKHSYSYFDPKQLTGIQCNFMQTGPDGIEGDLVTPEFGQELFKLATLPTTDEVAQCAEAYQNIVIQWEYKQSFAHITIDSTSPFSPWLTIIKKLLQDYPCA